MLGSLAKLRAHARLLTLKFRLWRFDDRFDMADAAAQYVAAGVAAYRTVSLEARWRPSCVGARRAGAPDALRAAVTTTAHASARTVPAVVARRARGLEGAARSTADDAVDVVERALRAELACHAGP